MFSRRPLKRPKRSRASVTAAPWPAGVRVWEVTSQGRGPRVGCPPPEGVDVAVDVAYPLGWPPGIGHARDVPHASQNLAFGELACWHRGHCIARPPGRFETKNSRIGGASLVWGTEWVKDGQKRPSPFEARLATPRCPRQSRILNWRAAGRWASRSEGTRIWPPKDGHESTQLDAVSPRPEPLRVPGQLLHPTPDVEDPAAACSLLHPRPPNQPRLHALRQQHVR
jgi:hypothetical protein